MKKLIAWVLLVTLLLGTFAGCGAQSTETPAASGDVEGINAAIDYLKAFYKDGGSQTGADFERFGIVRIGGVPYEGVWTADTDEVKAVVNDNGTVTIDVNEKCEKETTYKLTATVSDDAGNSASHSWEYILPASLGDDYAKIVDMAYALEKDAAMDYATTLVGTVTSINTAWSDEYKNITVTIIVEGREDKPIMCYRLKGDGAQDLAPGDLITVTGTLKNYNGTIEFDAGCQLLKLEKGENAVEIPTDTQEILKAAAALKPGEKLPYTATLTGKITGIGDRYSEKYGNVTVMIRTGDPWYPITCFRLKGEGVDKIWLDDVITVTRTLENYDGTLELSYGELVSWTDNPDPKAPSDPKKIVEAAYALGNYASLPYYCSLTGKVSKIVSKYDRVYQNVTVNMTVEGKTIQAYRLEGPGIESIKVGDTITVYGLLKNYKGTIEFDAGCDLINKQHEVVDDLYDLEAGESLTGEKVLTGKITKVNTPYNSQFKNVTVTIDTGDGRTVQCYRMTGNGADRIAVGDTITVRGTLKNYKGTYEFDTGCKLESWACGSIPYVDRFNTAEEVIAAAKKLGSTDYLHAFNLEGNIVSVDTAYDSKYGNVTVTMNVAGTPVQCYRMKGENTDKIAVGDFIRVYGDLINYNGKIQFNTGCQLQTWIDKSSDTEEPETPDTPVVPDTPTVDANSPMADVLAAAAALDNGKYLDFTYTLTGNVKTAYEYKPEYGNRTVIMAVGGTTAQCWQMKGTGVDKIAEGDTITVTGTLGKNDSGYITFAKGCTLVSWTDNTPDTEEPETPNLATPEAIVNAAFALESGKTLAGGPYSLTGTVQNAEAYDAEYGNVTFYLSVAGKLIQCKRTTADKAATLANGDTVTVSGNLQNYEGAVQVYRGTIIG